MPPPSDVVVVLALGGMLAVAFVHPSRQGRGAGRPGLCAGVTLATGLLTSAEVRDAVDQPGAGGRVPGHDPRGLRRLCPRRPLRRRRPARRAAGAVGSRRCCSPGVRAGGGRHRHAEPRRDRRAADPGRARRRPRPVGARRARHLRLPADGELRLAPAAGLQPDQPARPPPPRPDLHRLRGPDGAGARRRARRGVRRPAPAVPRRDLAGGPRPDRDARPTGPGRSRWSSWC